MSTYVRDQYCTGLPPVRVSRSGLFERNALVSKMMLERGKVRLLLAPTMMGKSSLAYLYAQMVFAFEGVFWLEAHHPFILRSLDQGTLDEEILQVSPDHGLVVFEDIPRFDDRRKREFARVCEKLLSCGLEVVATCIPNSDLSDLLNDSLFLQIASEDLLYSDAEFEDLQARGYLPIEFRAPACRAERIPGLLNRPSGSVERFLISQEIESGGAKDILLTYAMVLVGTGTLQELSQIMERRVSLDELHIQDKRPYVSSLSFGRLFCAEGFSASEVLRIMNSRMPSIASRLPGFETDRFMGRIAEVLFERGSMEKAAHVVMESCKATFRLEWIDSHAQRMNEHCAPLYVDLICGDFEESDFSDYPTARREHAHALMLLGETSKAQALLGNLAMDPGLDLGIRLRSATLMALMTRSHPSSLRFGEAFDCDCLRARRKGEGKSAPLDLWNSILEGDSGLGSMHRHLDSARCDSGWALSAACCLHGLSIAVANGEAERLDVQMLPDYIDELRDKVEALLGAGECESSLFLVKREIDSFRTTKIWSRSALTAFDQIEARLRSQQANFKRSSARHSSTGIPHVPVLFRANPMKLSSNTIMSVPVLDIRMFGRFEATIGGEQIERGKLSRLKTRSLLMLLALNAGKDLSCERLSNLLWPDSVPVKARHNFHSIYSMLKRALELPDGTCPYLSRSQGVCRLNSLYLRTDVEEVSELCQHLRYGRLSAEDAFALTERLRMVYQGELLPGEKAVPIVESTRISWKNRVVDSLLIAAGGLRGQGEIGAAMDFAQFALQCDNQREDVYELLMMLQYERKQRAGAIETYFAYRKANSALGLDASDRMTELYEGIINGDLNEELMTPVEDYS